MSHGIITSNIGIHNTSINKNKKSKSVITNRTKWQDWVIEEAWKDGLCSLPCFTGKASTEPCFALLLPWKGFYHQNKFFLLRRPVLINAGGQKLSKGRGLPWLVAACIGVLWRFTHIGQLRLIGKDRSFTTLQCVRAFLRCTGVARIQSHRLIAHIYAWTCLPSFSDSACDSLLGTQVSLPWSVKTTESAMVF